MNSKDTSEIDTSENNLLNYADSSITSFIMPQKDLVIKATYKPIFYTLTVENGSGSGLYTVGQKVMIKANTPPVGMIFNKWNCNGFTSLINDTMAYSTYITMTDSDIKIGAIYKTLCGCNVAFTVFYGTGSGTYDTSSVVDIAAYPPDSAGHAQCYVFNGWTAIPQSDTIYIKNLKDTNTVVTLPNISGSSILILATYIPLKHKLTINRGIVVYNATADSMYYFEDTLHIQANVPPPDSVFAGWSGLILPILSTTTHTFLVEIQKVVLSLFHQEKRKRLC